MPTFRLTKCKQCGDELLLRKGQVFCCKDCEFSWKKENVKIKGQRRNCPVCGREIYVKPSEFKHTKTCSMSCRKEYLKSSHGNRWKGGHVSALGYVRVWDNQKNGLVFAHRKEMEKHLGRKLRKNEVVHHKDGDKLNNKIENLELMDRSIHCSMHNKKRRFTNKIKLL